MSAAAPCPPGLLGRLSVMMFLQYAIWGAWLPILYPFLLGHRHFTLDQVGWIMAAGAAGAIFGPFVAGQIADRHFATEKFLAASHAAGAAVVWFLSTVTDYGAFLGLSLLYGFIYAPTISLTNSLSFHHLPDRDRDFGRVRVWGTIGWIAAGIGVGQWILYQYTPDDALAAVTAAQDAGRADAFRLSSVLGACLAAYCLTLPHTPPVKEAAHRNATFEALGEFGRSPLLILLFLAVPVSCIHQFYFVHTSDFLSALQRRVTAADEIATAINRVLGVGGGGLMTIGQMTEILVLAAIPLVAKKVSRKALLATGLAAYAGRMAIFAYAGSMPAILFGVALHGFCFGCFIFVAYMVVDEETTRDVQASAQNLFNLVIIGVGIIAGSKIATSVVGAMALTEIVDATGAKMIRMDYTKLFSVPMWASLACLAVLLLFYPSRRREASP